MYFINPAGSEFWAALQAIGGIAAIIAAWLIGSSQQRQERKFRREDAARQAAAEEKARSEIITFINHLIAGLVRSLESIATDIKKYELPDGCIDFKMPCYDKAPWMETAFARLQLQANNIAKRMLDEKDIFKIDVKHRIAWYELLNLMTMISQRASQHEKAFRDYSTFDDSDIEESVENYNKKWELARRRGDVNHSFNDDVRIFVAEVNRIIAGRPFGES